MNFNLEKKEYVSPKVEVFHVELEAVIASSLNPEEGMDPLPPSPGNSGGFRTMFPGRGDE